MRRRELIAGLGGATALGLVRGLAETAHPPRIGILRPGTSAANDPLINAFRKSLHERGYVEGENIEIVVLSAEGINQRLPRVAAELVARKPDVIVTSGEPAIRAVKAAAGSIPIVMAITGDPVAEGFAQSLAHPGGNLTGLSNLAAGLVAKRLEFLSELIPQPSCVGVLHNPEDRALDPLYMHEAEAAAGDLHVALQPVVARDAGDLDKAFTAVARQNCPALLAMADPLFYNARKRLARLATQYRIATIYDNPLIVRAGGLMAYGPDPEDLFRRAAFFVDRILKGAKPADLPIEQPTKFGLVVNMKAAKAIGITFPREILERADEVIE